jgi:hypothetical protein
LQWCGNPRYDLSRVLLDLLRKFWVGGHSQC